MNTKKKPSILFLSRPLIPPWDEADKNLAYLLKKNIKDQFKIDIIGANGIQDFIKLNRTLPKRKSWSVQLRLKILLDLLFYIRNYDIVHFFLMPRVYSNFFFKYLFRLFRVKVIQNLHCEPIRGEKPDDILWGDLVIVHSKYREAQLHLAGIQNVKNMPPGIDIEKFKKQNNKLKFRQVLNIREEIVIFYAGNNYRNYRDLNILLRMINTIKANSMPVKFILASRIRKKGFLHPYVQEDDLIKEVKFKQKIKEFKLEKYVIFLKTVENMPDLISAIDICIFPITEIGEKADIPMVILESMAMGKPILMSSLDPYAEALKYGGGITVSHKDVAGFVDALKTLILDKTLRETLGAEGNRAVREHFDIKRVVNIYVDLYHELLSSQY